MPDDPWAKPTDSPELARSASEGQEVRRGEDPRIARLLDGTGGALRGDDVGGRDRAPAVQDQETLVGPPAEESAQQTSVGDRSNGRGPEGNLERASVSTPYGEARQSLDPASLELRTRAEQGDEMYRRGVLGLQQGPEAQFWSGTHPLLERGFADQYGLPAGNTADEGHRFFVAAGTLDSGAQYVTRPAPGIGANAGGAPELVCAPGDVSLRWFHMPDDR